MTNEYISKQDALKGQKTGTFANGIRLVAEQCVPVDYIESLKPADVAPVVHSQWKYKCGEIQCPECGNRIHRIDLSGCLNFCPNCGSKMDAQGEE